MRKYRHYIDRSTRLGRLDVRIADGWMVSDSLRQFSVGVLIMGFLIGMLPASLTAIAFAVTVGTAAPLWLFSLTDFAFAGVFTGAVMAYVWGRSLHYKYRVAPSRDVMNAVLS